jgi:hypothetical protein
MDPGRNEELRLWIQEATSIGSGDGILGHQCDKRLESFALSNSSPFYWQILQKTIFYSGFKNPYKEVLET